MYESVFNKVADRWPGTLLKKRKTFLKNIVNSYFSISFLEIAVQSILKYCLMSVLDTIGTNVVIVCFNSEDLYKTLEASTKYVRVPKET